MTENTGSGLLQEAQLRGYTIEVDAYDDELIAFTDADEAWIFITGIDGAVNVRFSENNEPRGWAMIVHELDNEEVLADYSVWPDKRHWIDEYFNEAYERNSR